MAGEQTENRNVSCNLLRSAFYVCPICGNILHASGNAVICCCCCVTLPALEAERCDDDHRVILEGVEDEQFITVRHEMTKGHFISFLAWVTTDRVQLVKLYPEGSAQTRMQLRGMGRLYLYCNTVLCAAIKKVWGKIHQTFFKVSAQTTSYQSAA